MVAVVMEGVECEEDEMQVVHAVQCVQQACSDIRQRCQPHCNPCQECHDARNLCVSNPPTAKCNFGFTQILCRSSLSWISWNSLLFILWHVSSIELQKVFASGYRLGSPCMIRNHPRVGTSSNKQKVQGCFGGDHVELNKCSRIQGVLQMQSSSKFSPLRRRMYCWDEENISAALNLLQCLEYQRISWMTDKLHRILKRMSTNYTLELPSMKKHHHWKLLTCAYQHSSPIRAGFRHILEAHLPQAENPEGLPMQWELVSRPCVDGKQHALNWQEKYPQVPNPSLVPRRLLEGHINWPQDRWTACNTKDEGSHGEQYDSPQLSRCHSHLHLRSAPQ